MISIYVFDMNVRATCAIIDRGAAGVDEVQGTESKRVIDSAQPRSHSVAIETTVLSSSMGDVLRYLRTTSRRWRCKRRYFPDNFSGGARV